MSKQNTGRWWNMMKLATRRILYYSYLGSAENTHLVKRPKKSNYFWCNDHEYRAELIMPVPGLLRQWMIWTDSFIIIIYKIDKVNFWRQPLSRAENTYLCETAEEKQLLWCNDHEYRAELLQFLVCWQWMIWTDSFIIIIYRIDKVNFWWQPLSRMLSNIGKNNFRPNPYINSDYPNPASNPAKMPIL